MDTKQPILDLVRETDLPQLRVGDQEFAVIGKIPDDLDGINPMINQAYLEKYGHGEYPETVGQMTGKRYMEKTLELILK